MILQNDYVDCSIDIQPDSDVIVIKGQVLVMDNYDSAEVFAANPIDRMVNYTGSGLPFPCSRIAFESTPNYKFIDNKSGVFEATFKYPNSYYTEDQFTRVAPSVFFKFSRSYDEPVYVRFELPNRDILNVRTLTYRSLPRQGPQYYSAKEHEIPICGAEETMRRYKDIKIHKDLA